MRRARLEAPKVHHGLFRLFCAYIDWYLRRNFHAIRLSGASARLVPDGTGVVIVTNHPGWWDPLIFLTLASRLFPRRTHYGPIEAAALSKYKFFEKLGFFGVEPGTAAGAVRFLRLGEAILASGSSALWVTAQGTFADPRVRPLQLRSGVGHLLHRVGNVTVLPIAVEYPFWEERCPEALIRIGDPILIASGTDRSADEWTAVVTAALEQTQDRLASDSIARRRESFEVLASGSSGVGGIYDFWRSLKALLRGQRFNRAHGPERL